MIGAYCRGSKSTQTITVEAQAEKIEAWAKYQGHTEITLYCENESTALREERPVFARMMEHVRAGHISMVVVAKLDRISRSVVEFSNLLDELRELGVDLVVLDQQIDTTTATGRMVARVLITLAQWEREVIGERTTAALAHKKSKGAALGQAPYGWKKEPGPDGKMTVLVPDEEEQGRLLLIQKLRSNGHAHDYIANYLNDSHIPSRSGKPWHRRTVQDICERSKRTLAT